MEKHLEENTREILGIGFLMNEIGKIVERGTTN